MVDFVLSGQRESALIRMIELWIIVCYDGSCCKKRQFMLPVKKGHGYGIYFLEFLCVSGSSCYCVLYFTQKIEMICASGGQYSVLCQDGG